MLSTKLMRCAGLVLTLAVVCLLGAQRPACAWGPEGHEAQVRLIVQLMPPEIRSFFPPDDLNLLIQKYSDYPDDQSPFDPAEVGPDAVAYLATEHIYHRGGPLHTSLGEAVSFVLLTQAFREHNPAHAAVWMGALCHLLGDEAASNHDPLGHYFQWWLQKCDLKMGSGIGIDLSSVSRTPEGQAMLQKLVQGFTPTVLSDDPSTALIKLMMLGPEGNEFMAQRGRREVASWAIDATPEMHRDADEAMAEVGAEGARNAASAVLTAWTLAQENKSVEITPDVLAEFNRERVAFIQKLPLSDDSIYNGLLRPKAGPGAIGFMIEPSQRMQVCEFSFGAKYLMAAAMGEMQNAKLDYRSVDIRTLDDGPLPTPSDMPVLVLCAGSFDVSPAELKEIQAYADAGGKLLYIDGVGSSRGILGALSTAMVKGPDPLLPVEKSIFLTSAVQFQGPLQDALGSQPYSVLHPKGFIGGWQQPDCPFRIDASNSSIQVLASLHAGSEDFPVAAALVDQGGVRNIVLPEYLITPFLLSGENTLPNPSIPILDSVGNKVLFTSLHLLDPNIPSKNNGISG